MDGLIVCVYGVILPLFEAATEAVAPPHELDSTVGIASCPKVKPVSQGVTGRRTMSDKNGSVGTTWKSNFHGVARLCDSCRGHRGISSSIDYNIQQ